MQLNAFISITYYLRHATINIKYFSVPYFHVHILLLRTIGTRCDRRWSRVVYARIVHTFNYVHTRTVYYFIIVITLCTCMNTCDKWRGSIRSSANDDDRKTRVMYIPTLLSCIIIIDYLAAFTLRRRFVSVSTLFAHQQGRV